MCVRARHWWAYNCNVHSVWIEEIRLMRYWNASSRTKTMQAKKATPTLSRKQTDRHIETLRDRKNAINACLTDTVAIAAGAANDTLATSTVCLNNQTPDLVFATAYILSAPAHSHPPHFQVIGLFLLVCCRRTRSNAL
uniref:Uncharacterized protein n=1 Tax=Ceratitis capitata TaxID=7213 RepID=W8BRI2_CERCA